MNHSLPKTKAALSSSQSRVGGTDGLSFLSQAIVSFGENRTTKASRRMEHEPLTVGDESQQGAKVVAAVTQICVQGRLIMH